MPAYSRGLREVACLLSCLRGTASLPMPMHFRRTVNAYRKVYEYGLSPVRY